MLRFIQVSCVLVCLVGTAASAAPNVAPAGLGPGDPYRLAFVTSATRDMTSSNIGDYDAFVTGVANTNATLAALGTSWQVIGSTASIDARDHTNTNPNLGPGVPIYNLNGQLLAANNADLWDGVLSALLNFDENGDVASEDELFMATGTHDDGTIAFEFGATGLGGAMPGAGEATLTDFWINAGNGGDNTSTAAFYAISSTLFIPEPATASIALLATFAVATRRRH